jgi:hypothetical protein
MFVLFRDCFDRYVGLYGDADPLDVTQWNQLTYTVPADVREWDEKTSTCKNMYIGKHEFCGHS